MRYPKRRPSHGPAQDFVWMMWILEDSRPVINEVIESLRPIAYQAGVSLELGGAVSIRPCANSKAETPRASTCTGADERSLVIRISMSASQPRHL
jgi:hypothetical protein